MARVIKASNKKTSAIDPSVLQLEDTAAIHPQRRSEDFRKSSSVNSLNEFLKTFDQASKKLKISSPKQKNWDWI